MKTENELEPYGRLSLVSVVLTAVAVTVNHAYALGTGALALGAVLSVVPAALWWWFRTTRSRAAFAGYLLMNLWMIVGFGAIKGLWETTLPLFLGTLLSSLSTAFPTPPIRTFGFEASGLLTFIGSAFVLFYASKLLQAKHETTSGGARSGRTKANVSLAVSAAVAVAVMTGVYAQIDQDKWVAPANGVVKIGVIVPTTGQ